MSEARAREFSIDPATLRGLYSMIAVGDCMSPAIASGTKLLFSTTDQVRVGDLVAIWLRPESISDGGLPTRVKRLTKSAPCFVDVRDHRATVTVEQDNPRRSYVIRCADILAIHRCRGEYDPFRPGGA